jgi:hypothetical protein
MKKFLSKLIVISMVTAVLFVMLSFLRNGQIVSTYAYLAPTSLSSSSYPAPNTDSATRNSTNTKNQEAYPAPISKQPQNNSSISIPTDRNVAVSASGQIIDYMNASQIYKDKITYSSSGLPMVLPNKPSTLNLMNV